MNSDNAYGTADLPVAGVGCLLTLAWCSQRGKSGAKLSSGRQESKQRTNLCTCLHDFIQYARLWREHFLDYCDRKQATKQCLLKKTVVYMYSLQRSNKIDCISMGDGKTKKAPNWGAWPMERPLRGYNHPSSSSSSSIYFAQRQHEETVKNNEMHTRRIKIQW